MSTDTTASVSTHILDTSVGRPAGEVSVRLAARAGRAADWQALGGSATDADGRCKDLPALPEGTTHVRLDFAVEAYFDKSRKTPEDKTESKTEDKTESESEDKTESESEDKPEKENKPESKSEKKQADAQQDAPANRDSGAAQVFFPEVAITFAVSPGEHYHVPLLLNPFGYSVYRGS